MQQQQHLGKELDSLKLVSTLHENLALEKECKCGPTVKPLWTNSDDDRTCWQTCHFYKKETRTGKPGCEARGRSLQLHTNSLRAA